MEEGGKVGGEEYTVMHVWAGGKNGGEEQEQTEQWKDYYSSNWVIVVVVEILI